MCPYKNGQEPNDLLKSNLKVERWVEPPLHIGRRTVKKSVGRRTLKGLNNLARRNTPGQASNHQSHRRTGPTLKGLNTRQGPNPFRVKRCLGNCDPRVARGAQPWASYATPLA
jgi:hypothetical protein